ncbi:MAG: transposase [Chloroflexales bacterium]|nr:transposase [Chloroflexales bacterium]
MQLEKNNSGQLAGGLPYLAVSGLAKTKLGKSVFDAGWGELRFQLTYKAQWAGKHLVVVGRFFPSTRLCPACGAVNGDLTLADRTWTCNCGAIHDRDLNAACNIRDQGLRLLLAVGATESLNAPREPVRPATRGHSSTTGEAPPLGAG